MRAFSGSDLASAVFSPCNSFVLCYAVPSEQYLCLAVLDFDWLSSLSLYANILLQTQHRAAVAANTVVAATHAQ